MPTFNIIKIDDHTNVLKASSEISFIIFHIIYKKKTHNYLLRKYIYKIRKKRKFFKSRVYFITHIPATTTTTKKETFINAKYSN